MTHKLKTFEYRIENDVTIDSVSELRLCLQSQGKITNIFQPNQASS